MALGEVQLMIPFWSASANTVLKYTMELQLGWPVSYLLRAKIAKNMYELKAVWLEFCLSCFCLVKISSCEMTNGIFCGHGFLIKNNVTFSGQKRKQKQITESELLKKKSWQYIKEKMLPYSKIKKKTMMDSKINHFKICLCMWCRR